MVVYSSFQHCRMQKQSFGPVYNLDLFSACGYICVSRDCVPPKRDLEELITLCGGRIGTSLRPARILVGNAHSERYKHIKCVNEKWVLDSIQFNTLKPLSEYTLLWEGSGDLWFGCGWWGVNCERCFIYLWFHLRFVFALNMFLIQGPAPHSDYSLLVHWFCPFCQTFSSSHLWPDFLSISQISGMSSCHYFINPYTQAHLFHPWNVFVQSHSRFCHSWNISIKFFVTFVFRHHKQQNYTSE